MRFSPVFLFFVMTTFAVAVPAWAEDSAIVEAGQSKGVVIRSIKVEVRDVFDEPEQGWFYDAANNLKINSKEEIVRRELLFKVGDEFDSFILEESARNLRTLSFLREVRITPIRVGNEVDIIVSVQETWTLIPQFSFALGGGTDKTSVGIAEENLLGYGKRLEGYYADDEGRKKIEGVYDDNRVLGTQNRLLAGYFDRSDGYRSVNFVGLPFRSLVEPVSWALDSEVFDLVGRLFEAGDERYIFRQRHERFGAGYTFARGEPTELVRRYSFGYEYENDEFEDASVQDFQDVDVDPDTVSRDSALLATNRRLSGPFIAYQQIEPDFVSANYVDRFDRVQDFNVGDEYRMKVWYAPEVLGSRKDAFVLAMSRSGGVRISPKEFFRYSIGGDSRYEHHSFDNSLLFLDANYYHVMGTQFLSDTYIGKHTLAVSLRADYGRDFDRDNELLLGADTGLRGYDARTFVGDKRLVLNLEDRVHLVDDIYRLVSLGTAFFIDVGGTTENHLGEIFSNNLYGNVGFGLRFGFPRASGGGIARVDVAFPWRDGADGSKEFEPALLITVGQAFGSRIRHAAIGPEPANISIGQGE